ncbi:MAG: ankyrin repeat domain-containing protein [Puniceicoccales bacterium]|nr:ankyrin repeat domain-containing protein [Puniceicoccales bacterium]
MQYKGWICSGMLYSMGVFWLCGTTGLQATEKDAKAQVTETNETPIVSKIDYIIEAMYKGNSEKALRLLEGIENKDINCKGKIRSITLLGAAVILNHMNVAEVLLERGADLHIECFDPDREACAPRDERYGNSTAFGMAIIDNNKEIIKFLVKHGANVNTLIRGYTPLQGVWGNYFQLDEDGYFWPADSGPLRLDRDYLQLDGPNYFGVYDDCLQLLSPGHNGFLLDNKGLNILNDCCCENILELMRLLIENGSRTNTRGKKGDTILHYIAGSFSRGGPFSFELLDLLFGAGADPRIANNKGELPLQELKLPDHVAERFPERRENYSKLVDMFRQRTDELNAQKNQTCCKSDYQRTQDRFSRPPDYLLPTHAKPVHWTDHRHANYRGFTP